jgi:23S rRNA pseudouridine2605 synthase
MPGSVRLDRALSKLGIASRATSRALIADGRVMVDGRVVRDASFAIVPERASIAIDRVQARDTPWRTIALHKPRGVVTTRRDPEGRQTVFDLLGPLGEDAKSLVSVGRLDLASTGLLLLTTDTQLAAWLTDPANAIVRRYVVTARGEVSDDEAARLTRGIDGLQASAVEIRKRSRRETHLVIELVEGRNREIRRLMSAIGHEVTRLLRVSFGGIELGTLQPGRWREIDLDEVQRAFSVTPRAARGSDQSPSRAGQESGRRPAQRAARGRPRR